uniref:Uncharacterized protein n=1 Tax=Arundo donax TaxID=35708 RepID=A0A0A8YSK3_ARUDO
MENTVSQQRNTINNFNTIKVDAKHYIPSPYTCSIIEC